MRAWVGVLGAVQESGRHEEAMDALTSHLGLGKYSRYATS